MESGAIQKLRKVLDDSPSDPRYIETLSKKGYRLIASVTAPIEISNVDAELVGGSRSSWLREYRTGFLAASAVLLLGMALVWAWIRLDDSGPRIADSQIVGAPKTVAVLPFKSLSHDPEDAYFADGMSDDLLASLARYSDLQVIARDSSFLYREDSLDPRELADRLGVRYLLRGSVRREGGRLRVSAQLLDSDSGIAIWADSFDDENSRIFDLQDQIAHRIVTALVGRINVRDRQELSRPRTSNLQAYDYFLYGRQRFFRYASAEENRKARESFLRALALDPEFALAQAMLGWTYAFDAMNGWAELRTEALQHALDHATKAIALDEAMPVAYFVRGLVYRELGNRVRALVEAEKAIEWDPNYAGAHVLLATLLYFDGKAAEGLELMKKAIALNPNHPFNYSFHLGQAFYVLGRYREAVEAFNKVLKSNPAAERAHVWLAAAYAQTGQLEDAQWEVDQVLGANPGFSPARLEESLPFRNPEDLERLSEGLRKAGFEW